MIKAKFLLILFCITLLSHLEVNAKNKSKLDIVFIGNSITYGGGLEKPLEEAPPVIVSELLRKRKTIDSVNFSNQGRSGFTTVNYLPGGVTLKKVIAATLKLHQDSTRQLIFSLSLGTNDSAEEGPEGSPVQPSDYHQNLKAITDQLLATFPGCKVIYQQPIWYSPNTYNGSRYMAEGLSRLQQYFPELRMLVKEYKKTQPKRVYMGDTKAYKYFKINYLSYLLPENGKKGTFYLHPNKKGASVLANFWAEAIHKTLR
jgi:lysophospholipase L1-like esterase